MRVGPVAAREPIGRGSDRTTKVWRASRGMDSPRRQTLVRVSICRAAYNLAYSKMPQSSRPIKARRSVAIGRELFSYSPRPGRPSDVRDMIWAFSGV